MVSLSHTHAFVKFTLALLHRGKRELHTVLVNKDSLTALNRLKFSSGCVVTVCQKTEVQICDVCVCVMDGDI